MLPVFIYRNKQTILFSFLLLISLLMMLISSQNIFINVKSFFGGMLSPFQNGFYLFNKFTKSFWVSIDELKSLKLELQRTYDKLQQLEGASYQIEELKRENERLRLLIDNRKKIGYDTIIAEVISKDPQNFYNTIIVNKGIVDGVTVNMPVVAYQQAEKGVVGKVFEVSPHSCKILPLIDEASYIGGMLQDSRYTGIVKGQAGESSYLVMKYVDRNAMINFGDIVVTSGQGGIFPKGLQIGKVVGVQETGYGLFYQAVNILPTINFSSLEEVYIIKKYQSLAEFEEEK